VTRRVLVINPVAGGRTEPADVVEAIRRTAGAEVEIRVTGDEGDARLLGKESAASGADEVWVAGGDGTLHEVVLGLRDAEVHALPTLVPLPLGTGNDLVRSLGIPLDWREAAEALSATSRSVKLDLMDVTLDGERQLGLNTVIAGNGGRVGQVLGREGKSRWGPLAYLRSAVEVALELDPFEATLQVDEGPEESLRLLNVIVANGRYAGHGIPIAPGARPDDGVLELVTIHEAGLPEVLRMLPSLLDETQPDHEAWFQRPVTSVRLRTSASAPVPVSVDGENLSAREILVSLADDGIQVRVPPPQSEDEDER
jgi:diacylglycerol kinase (ATP)